MSLSMYTATVTSYRLMLKNLSAVMAKAEAHCEAKKIDPNAFLTSRLYPDMLPFTAQVQIATDNVKGAAGRLSGAEIPKFEDNETTFPELQARIDKTVAFLDTLTEVSSHELCEAITDPTLGTWFDPNTNNEIGDICNRQTVRLGNFLVQTEWSNELTSCAFAR